MKKFKLVDFYLQAILVTLAFVLPLLFRGSYFLYGYVVVLGWQIMSAAVHFVKKWFGDSMPRRVYHGALLAMACLLILGMLISRLLIASMFLFLYGVPVLILYYVIVSYRETFLVPENQHSEVKG